MAKKRERPALPQVERLVSACEAEERLPRAALVQAARRVLDEFRRGWLAGSVRSLPNENELAAIVLARARSWIGEGEPRVLNATGVPLHTNLGRAPLAAAAAEAVARAARGYVALEFDLAKGERSQRGAAAEDRLRALTGCEAALVVNNNAAAVLLVLSALASGKRVIVSRGELIEIGGSYRLPEVFEKSGAELVEVGTTNRTHLRDYERVLAKKSDPRVALVLRVHPSNYRTVGFTARPSLEELATLCRRHRVPLVEDLGSGALVDLSRYGLTGEPTIQAVLKGGADLVCASGDKLLGGPQCGMLLGRAKLVAACRKDPLARAVRVDKLTFAALDATLALYFDPERAGTEIPTLRMLTLTPDELRARAEILAASLARIAGLAVEVRKDAGEAGGGTLPALELPTWVVAVRAQNLSSAELEERLRLGQPPLVARVKGGRVLLDPRTLLDEPLDEVAHALEAAVRSESRTESWGG
ncbi:MAG TPA: L-seryl-tRNA(Sec) selenium transferase [Candidatus Eisenbacteria bacterium]|jgi:L-seryl-tRNA(Ser) seleniumtransferase|nr:L-seryl-tRNA(Sec) selenium transferase [Candidatus Eisenbacteria bacterium]